MNRVVGAIGTLLAGFLLTAGCGASGNGNVKRGLSASPPGAGPAVTPPPPADEPAVTPPPPTAAQPRPALIGLGCFARVRMQTKPQILASSRRGGRGIPNSTLHYRIGPQQYNILGPSTDPEYGYTPEKPVFTGGRFSNGSARQWRFLKTLTGPNGNRVYFERVGSCCRFRDPQGRRSGLVDVYAVILANTRKVVYLYLSLYAPTNEPIRVPMCFQFHRPSYSF